MSRVKILIIDDEIDLVQLTGKRLRAAGYDVEFHHDGRGALDVIKRTQPDLILLDIKLPNISGIDIFRELRRQPLLKSIPVLFFSASTRVDDVCIEDLGAEGFIKKPYKSRAFFEEINRALANRRER